MGDPWTDQGFSGGNGWDDADDTAEPESDDGLLDPEELEEDEDDAWDDGDADDE